MRSLSILLPCKSKPKLPSRHGLLANIMYTNQENSKRLRDYSVGSLDRKLYKIIFVAVIGFMCSMGLMRVAHSVEY
jgi:hypothetical protein